MSHTRRFLVLSALVALSSACQVGENSPDWEDYEFRCADTPSGLVGLELVDIAGTPTISGVAASVFSNELVTLAGSFDIEGDAISGGTVAISGSNRPDGRVVENATRVDAPDTADAVDAARLENDNDKIPCIPKGNRCTEVVSGFALSMNAQQQITLPAGTYYFESISINGQAQLNIDGDVVIYLDGPATFNGGSATNPDEDSLALISASTAEIKLNGSSAAAIHIVAPKATVRFAGTHVALVGEACQPPAGGGSSDPRGDRGSRTNKDN